MTSKLTCAGLGLAVLLSTSSLLLANDKAPLVGPVPVTPVPSTVLEEMTPVPKPAPAPVPVAEPGWAPGGDAVNGMRVGRPYYWSAPGAAPVAGYGAPAFNPEVGPAPAAGGCGCNGGAANGFSGDYGVNGSYGFGGGYAGTPYYGGYNYGMDPYTEHFGPGYHRQAISGHNRFPGYSYRRPWYYPGLPSYNRDTNLPW